MKRKEKGTKNIKIKSPIIWVVVGIFIVFNIFFTIQISTSGAELSDLQDEKERLIEENQALEREIVKNSSLRNLEKDADTLGFIKPQKVIYITEEQVVAKAP